MSYSIVVKGNPEDPTGNPIPYKRSTKRSQWKPEIMLYNQWKDYVRSTMFRAYPDTQWQAGGRYKLQIHPFTTSQATPARLDIMIYYKNRHFGDPDNIFKGIADALFKCDKYLAGSFNFGMAAEGRVEIKVSPLRPEVSSL